LQLRGLRRLIYNILNWLPFFRIEARMFLNLTDVEVKWRVISRTVTEITVTEMEIEKI
jgi:hypothetical protein